MLVAHLLEGNNIKGDQVPPAANGCEEDTVSRGAATQSEENDDDAYGTTVCLVCFGVRGRRVVGSTLMGWRKPFFAETLRPKIDSIPARRRNRQFC